MKINLPLKNDDLPVAENSYEPPLIEVIEVTIEKGFAASATGWNPDTW